MPSTARPGLDLRQLVALPAHTGATDCCVKFEVIAIVPIFRRPCPYSSMCASGFGIRKSRGLGQVSTHSGPSRL